MSFAHYACTQMKWGSCRLARSWWTSRKTWRVPRFEVGGVSGDNRGVEIALAGANAKIFLDYWAVAHEVHKVAMKELRELPSNNSKAKWLPAIRKWPTDLLTCDRVELKRK